MIANQPGYRAVWSMNEPGKALPGSAKQVKRFSLRYYYYLSRARYWISNARMPNNVKKREGQTYLQTWHGTPLKCLAGDMDNVLMPGTNPITYKINFANETAKWDYLVSPNAYSSEIFRRAFWFNNEMLEFGYPRNDVLYTKNNSTDIQTIKEKLGLPTDKKVILYAPTWRDDDYYGKGEYRFSIKLDLEKMRAQLSDEYVIVLRMHYLIASAMEIDETDTFIYDFSDYDDIAELYLVSDVLITDYSSVFFDYANLKRPILFYTYDLEKYAEELRGFYLDMHKDVPGPLLETSDEVLEALLQIDDIAEKYQDRYEVFYHRFCEWDDGNASQHIIEKVFHIED